MDQRLRALEKAANELRYDVVKMIHDARDGHPGPALSALDIIATLYLEVMQVKPEDPTWEDRDRFVLSKGHACPALYAALARRGFFPVEELASLRALGSRLQGHPVMGKTPGIDATTGSLGNGIAVAVGMALAAKYLNKSFNVYAVMGDGEQEEGIVWEAAMAAKQYALGNLIVFLDNNGMQSGGGIASCSGVLPIREKWEAFGWDVQEIDGHSHKAILEAVHAAHAGQERPHLILAHTIKGKGIDYMEHDNSWHKRVPDDEQLVRAAQQLGIAF